jgi:hypothetical protein
VIELKIQNNKKHSPKLKQYKTKKSGAAKKIKDDFRS